MDIPARPGFIGIDIGSCTVKMAQIQKRANGYAIVDATIVPRPHPWNFDSWHESDPRSSSAEIQAARSMGFAFSGKTAAATTTMALCDTRGMKIDLTSDDLLNRQQILSEMEQLERFDVESREIDYWTIKQQWQIYGANVQVMSLKSQWAKQIANDQAVARLQCQTLDGLPMALARAANMSNAYPQGQPVAIVDWGYTRATLCVSVDGSPVFVRMLRGSGFDNIIQAVCEALDVQPNEATRLLLETGLPSPLRADCEMQKTLEEAMTEPLAVFCGELIRTLGCLKQDQPGNVPHQLILSGGGSTVRNISSWIEKRSKLRVRPWSLAGCNATIGPHESLPISLFAPALALSSLAWDKVGSTADANNSVKLS